MIQLKGGRPTSRGAWQCRSVGGEGPNQLCRGSREGWWSGESQFKMKGALVVEAQMSCAGAAEKESCQVRYGNRCISRNEGRSLAVQECWWRRPRLAVQGSREGKWSGVIQSQRALLERGEPGSNALLMMKAQVERVTVEISSMVSTSPFTPRPPHLCEVARGVGEGRRTVLVVAHLLRVPQRGQR